MAHVLSLTSVLGAGTELPLWAAVGVVAIGGVYLVFGKRLFRILIVGVGAAAGFEIGRVAAVHFGLPVVWVSVPAALLVGGMAWPAWQLGLFLAGGVAAALVTSEALVSTTGDSEHLLWGTIGGFVLGGVVSILLIKAASIFLTALLGAFLVYLGGVRLLMLVWAGAATLPRMTLVSLSIIGVLTLAGVVAQMAQPDAELAAQRKREDAERRAKDAEDADKKARWERYISGQ